MDGGMCKVGEDRMRMKKRMQSARERCRGRKRAGREWELRRDEGGTETLGVEGLTHTEWG